MPPTPEEIAEEALNDLYPDVSLVVHRDHALGLHDTYLIYCPLCILEGR